MLILIWLWLAQLPAATAKPVRTVTDLAARLAQQPHATATIGRLPPTYASLSPSIHVSEGAQHASALHWGGSEGAQHAHDYDLAPGYSHGSMMDDYDFGVGIDGAPHGMLALSAIRMFLPDGEITTPASERYELCSATGMQFGKHPQVSTADKQQLKDMVMSMYDTAFAKDMKDLTGYRGDIGPVQIQVISDKAVFSRPRKQSQLDKDVCDKKCIEMRDAGIIEPAPRSKYASCPTVAAKKAPDGTWTDTRYCIDFRQINQITAPHNTRFPLADENFQELGDSRFFSKLDMRSGFFQLIVHDDTKPLTAFWWNGALWQYKRAPFGLKQLPQMFQEVMDYELHKHGLSAFTKAFIDDLLIHSATFQDHIKHIQQVLQMFVNVGLRAHPEKCLFCSDTVEFLGFDVSRHGLTPNEAKVRALLDMAHPRNLDELRSVLGKLRYYSVFVNNWSSIARPMLDLLKKGAKWEWDMQLHPCMALHWTKYGLRWLHQARLCSALIPVNPYLCTVIFRTLAWVLSLPKRMTWVGSAWLHASVDH